MAEQKLPNHIPALYYSFSYRTKNGSNANDLAVVG
jgi:hypothetical protein